MDKEFHLIIVAAGKGTRIDADIPKQYLEIAGKSLLTHTLDAFSTINGLKSLCLVVNPNDKVHYERIMMDWSKDIPIQIAFGGRTRQQSVHNGLDTLSLRDKDIVLIHDSARPFIDKRDINALLNALEHNEGASLAYKITDTCRRVSELDMAQEAVSRENLLGLQTPQAFHFGAIKKAHNLCDLNKEYTDDTALFSDMMNCDVKLVEASRHNFKITTKEDIAMAEKILSSNVLRETHIGMGYDVHAFDDDVSNADVTTVRLCGIDVPHDRKLKGHSDADVGLHALCDAIYGALGAGDIGQHFPPSNMAYKDMDSAKFLEHAVTLMKDRNARLINADITLICEKPKITPYKEQIQLRIAEIMGTLSARINVKATTTEGLGFAGRKEGIAANAIVSIEISHD